MDVASMFEEPVYGRRPDGVLPKVQLAVGTIAGEKRLFIKVAQVYRLRAQRLPSAVWLSESQCWHVPWSPGSVGPFEQEFPSTQFEVVFGDGVRDLWGHARSWRDAQKNLVSWKDLPDLPIKGSAWPHQRMVFHFARVLEASGLFVDMGGGKSLIATALLHEKEAKSVLVLCPKSVLGVWPKEITKWSLDRWDTWSGAAQSGTVFKKANHLASWLAFRNPHAGMRRMVVINYDSCWRPGMADVLLNEQWDVVICDESHKIKSPGGKASRFAAKIRKNSKEMWLLTGTPTPRGPEDIYAQYRAADPGIFGTNYARFIKKYFETKKVNDKIEVVHHRNGLDGFRDERAREEFQAKMRSIGILVPREDMVPPSDGVGIDPSRRWVLPPVERQVQLEPKTFKAYQALKNELIAEVDEGVVVADNALTKLLRLRQLTSGAVRVENTATGATEVQQLSTEKRSLLADVIDDIPDDEPIVVFGAFHSDLDAVAWVAEETGRPYLELSGRRRDGLSADSTLAGTGPELVGVQLQSGGVGIDFTRSCYLVYFAVDYNLGNVLQSRDRLDRPGQTRPITEIHLVAVTPNGGKTVDGITYEMLLERKMSNDRILEALRHG